MEFLDRDTVMDLTHNVIAHAAPHELPLIQPMGEAFFSDRRSRGTQDEMLGFGASDVLALTPYVLTITPMVIGFVNDVVRRSIQDATADLIGAAVRRVVLRKSGQETKSSAVPLTRQQTAELRSLILRRSQTLKLPEDKAELLADSIIGSLWTET